MDDMERKKLNEEVGYYLKKVDEVWEEKIKVEQELTELKELVRDFIDRCDGELLISQMWIDKLKQKVR